MAIGTEAWRTARVLSTEDLHKALEAGIERDARYDRKGVKSYNSPLASYNRALIKAYRKELANRKK